MPAPVPFSDVCCALLPQCTNRDRRGRDRAIVEMVSAAAAGRPRAVRNPAANGCVGRPFPFASIVGGVSQVQQTGRSTASSLGTLLLGNFRVRDALHRTIFQWLQGIGRTATRLRDTLWPELEYCQGPNQPGRAPHAARLGPGLPISGSMAKHSRCIPSMSGLMSMNLSSSPDRP